MTAQRLVFRLAADGPEAEAREREVVERQKQWARDAADRIERGELPSADQERQVLAWIVRGWANQPPIKAPAKRGNPKFKRKVSGAADVARDIAFRIAFGDDPPAAIAHVADVYDIDESTAAKMFREHRESLADLIECSNLAARAGAIRGE